MSDEALNQAIDFQIAAMQAMDAPFGAEFLRRTTAALNGPVGALFAPWRDADTLQIIRDAAALRLLAAFTHLARSSDAPALATEFPAAKPVIDWGRLWPAVETAARDHAPRLADFMTHEPQTNEVRRSACLLGGFLTITAETRLPLRAFELGASAGLNLSWDRFAYRLGEHAWGDPASPVQIETDWSGPPPPLPLTVTVVERAGCDRRPARLDDAVERARLEAYVWPGQPERLDRLQRAADLALAAGITVERSDAADWLERRVGLRPGTATVVYHSVFWQYPPEPIRHRLLAGIEALGAAATRKAPFAWLRMEPDLDDPSRAMAVTLTLWPDGVERRLAYVHPHGAFVRWEGPAG